MLSAAVLAVPPLTMVSCFCLRRWEFEGQRQIIRLCVSPFAPRGGEEAGERESHTVRDVGGEREG